jgi:hypothetical protein
MDGAPGATSIDKRTALLTVSVVEALTLPSVAEITALPTVCEFVSPCRLLAFETVATRVAEDAQTTLVVMSCFEPSPYTPVALKHTDVPSAIVGSFGAISMATNGARSSVTVTTLLAREPSKLALNTA